MRGASLTDAGLTHRPQSVAGRSIQLVSSIHDTLRAFAEGRLMSWLDVIRLSHQ